MRYLSFCLLLFGILVFSMPASRAQQNGVCYQGKILGGDIQSGGCDGETLGTVGESLPLEWIKIYLADSQERGMCNVRYRAHVQNIGWMDWVTDFFNFAGTADQGLRLEAFEAIIDHCPDLRLRYRAHVQDIGWMDWVEAGQTAGTTGRSLRLEAIQVTVENPAPHYDYQGRDYPFYDIESGEVFLPILRIAENNQTRHIQTRLTPTQGLFSFHLDMAVPSVTSNSVQLSQPISIPHLSPLLDIKRLKVPNLVVHSADNVDIYDVTLEANVETPEQYQLKKIHHLPVPVSIENFHHCTDTRIPAAQAYVSSYNYAIAQANAYLTYELVTGKVPADNNKGLAVMSCCRGFIYSLWRLPASIEHDNGAYCINAEN